MLPGRLSVAAAGSSIVRRRPPGAAVQLGVRGRCPTSRTCRSGRARSHDPARGSETLVAYRRFAEHAGSQERAFTGEPEWTPQRRFERVFERLALPGFGRMGRYDLLVTLGRLGLYELRADSLHLGTRTSLFASDPTPQAAKRIFGIGDPITSSGVHPRSPRHSPRRSKRSTWLWRTGRLRSASRSGSRPTRTTRTPSSAPSRCSNCREGVPLRSRVGRLGPGVLCGLGQPFRVPRARARSRTHAPRGAGGFAVHTDA